MDGHSDPSRLVYFTLFSSTQRAPEQIGQLSLLKRVPQRCLLIPQTVPHPSLQYCRMPLRLDWGHSPNSEIGRQPFGLACTRAAASNPLCRTVLSHRLAVRVALFCHLSHL